MSYRPPSSCSHGLPKRRVPANTPRQKESKPKSRQDAHVDHVQRNLRSLSYTNRRDDEPVAPKPTHTRPMRPHQTHPIAYSHVLIPRLSRRRPPEHEPARRQHPRELGHLVVDVLGPRREPVQVVHDHGARERARRETTEDANQY